MSIFTAIENLIAPEFDGNYNGPDLSRAFRLLARAVIVFGLAIALWSLAAGLLEAGKWTGGSLLEERYKDWQKWPNWLLVPIGGLLLGAKLLGALSLIAMAAGLVGGFLGFLFGLPSRPAGTPASTDQPDKAGGTAGTPLGSAPGGWVPSTNLIQITDWLTKIIVGVGLVEAKAAFTAFQTISNTASQQLLGGAFGSGLVVPAVMLGALVLGFKLCNLYTLLFLARLIAEAGITISGLTPGQQNAVRLLKDISPNASVIAGPIRPDSLSDGASLPKEETPAATPTEAQRDAAIEIGEQPLDKLNTFDTVLAWSRGKALLNKYDQAAAGYKKLRMLAGSLGWELLSEAARVFAGAGLENDAKEALAQARESVSQQEPSRQVSVLRDQVVYLLYADPPQGYRQALIALKDDEVVNADASGELALFRACALGQKFRHEEKLSTEEQTKALNNVKTALSRGQSPEWIRYLADPDAAGKKNVAANAREDDLEPFSDNEEFRKIVGLPPLGKPVDKPNPG